MDDLEKTLHRFILTNYLQGERPENLTNTTPLQSSGILDSLAVLGVVTFVEKTYGVQFTAYETTADQLDSIGDLVRLVAGKRAPISA